MFIKFRLLEEAVALSMASRLHSAVWGDGLVRGGEVQKDIKDNDELLIRNEDDPGWDSVKLIQESILKHGGIMAATMLYKMTLPKFNRYTGGGTYRRHYDASPMTEATMRTDFACTIALTPPDDYDDGDLHVESPEGGIVKAPRCGPGECVVYECGNAHWVTPVTRGERVSAILWIRSLVKGTEERRLLVRLTDILQRTRRTKEPIEIEGNDYTTLTGIQTALCRMWIDA